MYGKALVPLDGSEVAECALSHARMLAQEGAVKELTLLSVIRLEPSWGTEPAGHEIRGKLLLAAAQYLTGVAARLAAEGLRVKTATVAAERPAQAITEYAHKNGMDLIVLSTHGYTGLRKLLLGSVANEVLHASHVPVLLIRPESCCAGDCA